MELQLDSMAGAIGVSVPVLRFLLCFVITIPVSFLWRFVPSRLAKHVYSAVSGFLLSYLSFGFSSNLHFLVPMLLGYASMVLFRSRCGVLTFFLGFGYLIGCHVYYMSGDAWKEGGIDATGALMVLTLKVISCAINYNDGLLKEEGLSETQKKNRLIKLPSLIEYFGYCLSCGSHFAGPVYEMKDYLDWTEGKGIWSHSENGPSPSPYGAMVRALLQAAFCMALYLYLVPQHPLSRFTDPIYQGWGFWKRLSYQFMAGFTARWKYYFIWSISEASIIISGLGFTGWTESSPPKPRWDRAKNVDILGVEFAKSAVELPLVWNIQVSTWLRRYVYEKTMSLTTRLRHSLTYSHRVATHLHHFYSTSSILSQNSSTPLSSKSKTRSALSLLKSEQNPHKILEICHAASLTPESHLDRIAFSVAISKLSESNHFDTIRQFLDDLLTSRPDLKTERFASHAIVLYGQAKMIPQAIDTFKRIHDLGIPRTVKSLNALLFACLLAKDYKELNRVYIEFPKFYEIQPNLDTFNTVIKGFSESGSTSSGYSVLAEMERKSVKPNATTFGNLLAGFYKEEKFEDVGKVLKLMENHGVNRGIGTYNIRIQSLCKLKKSSEAKALMDGMLSRGMKPNSDTYSHLIHGFCKEGDLEEGKKLLKSMKSRGIQPSSDCYYSLVYFLCQGKDFDSALSIAKESMEKGWVPNFGTMKSLVEGLVGVSKVDEAREVIKQVKEKVTKNVEMWDEIEAGLPQ